MKHLSSSIALALTVIAAAFIGFQNCAEVRYLRPDSGGIDKILGDEGNPRRLLLTPTFTSKGLVSPVKILLVIDNSKSMTLNNRKLKDSVHTLLEPLKNIPVQLKIITTDALSQDRAAMESQGWSVAVSGLSPKVSASSYLKNKFGILPHEVFAQGYDVFYYLNRVDLYDFLAEDPDFDAKVETVKNRIMQISASGKGSDREQALCNTLLALYDQGPNRHFHPGDKAAIVILTDEDDGSRWHTMDTTEWRRDCRNRYTYGSIGDTSQPNVENINYQLKTWNIKFEVAYERLNDGVAENKSAGDNGGIPVSPSRFPELIDADQSVRLECGNNELDSALNYAKHLVGSSLTRNVQVKNCRIEPAWTALYEFGDSSEDRCGSPFAVKGSNGGTNSYQNMADYYRVAKSAILAKGACARQVSQGMKRRGFSDFYIDGALDPAILGTDRLPLARHVPSIQKAIMNRSRELFGENGFYVSSIIHKTNQCVQGPSQSIGRSFMSLPDQTPELAGRVFTSSICDADYRSSLSDLSRMISREFGAEIALNQVLADEEVESVVVQRGEVEIPLVKDVDYRLEGLEGSSALNLVFEMSRIELGDLIRVTLKKK